TVMACWKGLCRVNVSIDAGSDGVGAPRRGTAIWSLDITASRSVYGSSGASTRVTITAAAPVHRSVGVVNVSVTRAWHRDTPGAGSGGPAPASLEAPSAGSSRSP